MTTNSTNDVTLIEVGPRDGLQNETAFVPTTTKVEFIDRLSKSGLRHIEVTSFVSPKVIPQLADNEAVFKRIAKPKNVCFSALVPNKQGLQNAIQAGVNRIAIFTAASELFNQHNINCSIEESLQRFEPIMEIAKQKQLSVRGYISCVLGCPYEGAIAPEKVVAIAKQLMRMGVDEISFGDTIGVGTPKQTKALIHALEDALPISSIAMHFHDTYGQAVANIYTALESGVRRFDSSVAGLGGCPYARGATGNVATEDVLYLLHGLNMNTGVDIYQIVTAGKMICQALNKKNQSKVANALLANMD